MSRRTLDSPLVLEVLVLLSEQSSHPYQLLTKLRSNRNRYGEAVLSAGTLYNQIGGLYDAGWITPQGKQRKGNRPERTMYGLTPSGSEEIVRRIEDLLRAPESSFTQVLGAVRHLSLLRPHLVLNALKERALTLRQRVFEAEKQLSKSVTEGTPRLYALDVELEIFLARAEQSWVDATMQEIRTGSLVWPSVSSYES